MKCNLFRNLKLQYCLYQVLACFSIDLKYTMDTEPIVSATRRRRDIKVPLCLSAPVPKCLV